MVRDPRTWLHDITEAGERLRRFIDRKSWLDYQSDELLRAGVERQFEIIGEALNQLRRQFPQIAERIPDHEKIIGFRNILIHGYAVIDDAIVWSAATEKLPSVIVAAAELIQQLPDPVDWSKR